MKEDPAVINICSSSVNNNVDRYWIENIYRMATQNAFTFLSTSLSKNSIEADVKKAKVNYYSHECMFMSTAMVRVQDDRN